MNAATQETRTSPALPYLDDNVSLTSRVDVNRELTRYVFCLGDHIEPQDKQHLKNAGGWAGGLYVGHSENNGAPCMKRTSYMVYRGGLIPLETTPIAKKADHREEKAADENFLTGPGVPPGTRGYTVYAGDNLNYLMNDIFRPMGLVEITPLMGRNWSTGEALTVQRFFFPEWDNWARGVDKFPTLLSDWELMIDQAIAKATDEIVETIGYEMKESGRLFRQYASFQIEKNRQAILSQRTKDNGGFYIGWTEKAKLYAKQLGEALEDSNSIQRSDPAAKELAIKMDREYELRLKELEAQREQNRMLMAFLTQNIGTPSGGNIVVPPLDLVTPQEAIEDLKQQVLDETNIIEPQTDEAIKDIELTEEQKEALGQQVSDGSAELKRCSGTTRKGDPCMSFTQPGETLCPRHKALQEKENN